MALVSCFCGSEPALAGLLGSPRGPTWLESLARLRPELELEPAGAVLSRWDDDPWAGAAYSVSPAPDLVAALRRPLGPLAFAGEHLGGRFHGLMEGALRSGREAAEPAQALIRSPCGVEQRLRRDLPLDPAAEDLDREPSVPGSARSGGR